MHIIYLALCCSQPWLQKCFFFIKKTKTRKCSLHVYKRDGMCANTSTIWSVCVKRCWFVLFYFVRKMPHAKYGSCIDNETKWRDRQTDSMLCMHIIHIYIYVRLSASTSHIYFCQLKCSAMRHLFPSSSNRFSSPLVERYYGLCKFLIRTFSSKWIDNSILWIVIRCKYALHAYAN